MSMQSDYKYGFVTDIEAFADVGRWNGWLILRFSPHDARLPRTASDIGIIVENSRVFPALPLTERQRNAANHGAVWRIEWFRDVL